MPPAPICSIMRYRPKLWPVVATISPVALMLGLAENQVNVQLFALLVARDLSALRAARVADHGKHGGLLEGRDGAGDESAGSDFTGDGETDHLVAGGGDRRHQRPLDAAVAGTLPGVWLRWAV